MTAKIKPVVTNIKSDDGYAQFLNLYRLHLLYGI